ncbi:MAG: hypothetical protein HYS38_09435, partial [Acidobacteria bacterium]|nr:hypothetical protein [Acidobacteriota bacterium]
TIEMVNRECRCAGIGCVEDKKLMADNLLQALAPLQERRRQYENNPKLVWEILEAGSGKARQTAQATMAEVRAAMNLAALPSAAPNAGPIQQEKGISPEAKPGGPAAKDTLLYPAD